MTVNGHAVLNEQIRRLRALDGMVERSAPAVARNLQQEVLAQASRQEGPDGQAWKPTKAGTPALRNIANSLRSTAIGTVVLITLTGRHARHHIGAVRGRVRRQVLPSGKLPAPAVRAIARVVTDEFRRTMGGK